MRCQRNGWVNYRRHMAPTPAATCAAPGHSSTEGGDRIAAVAVAAWHLPTAGDKLGLGTDVVYTDQHPQDWADVYNGHKAPV